MREKIKVGFLTERMLLGFGVDLIIHKTAQELMKQGFDVTVFCLRTDGTYENEEYTLVELSSPLYKNPIKTEYKTSHLLKRLNHEDIDVWVTQTYPFFIAPHFLKNPVIAVDAGIVSTEGFSLFRRIPFWYMHVTQNYLYFPKATHIVNISSFTQSLTPRLLRKKQSVIYLGVDHYETEHSTEQVSTFRHTHNIADHEKLLLYVGRLNHTEQPYKNTDGLLRIYAKAKSKDPNIVLAMAGYGSPEDEIYLQKNGVKVFRAAPQETLSLLYAATDIYVSATKWEGFNLPLIESGLNNAPSIVFDIPAHREVLKENHLAKLVQTEEEFCDAIIELSTNNGLRQQSALTAKSNAERFTWKKTGTAYAELITKIYDTHKDQIEGNRSKHNKDLVDVITLNYNGKKFLGPLFDSLKNQAYKNIRVTMVDNNSHDDSVDYVEKNYPWVNIIKSEKNLFFSKGNNLAVSKTNGEYIYFVNNDSVVEKDAIQNFIKTMRGKDILTAALAGKIIFKDKNEKKIIDAVGTVITKTGALFNRGVGQIDIGQYDQEEEVFGACFGSVFLRRKMYTNIVKPLDNSYFGYFEDVDWCYRARIMGYKIFTCPSAIIEHVHSGTTKQKNYNWKYYYIHRNFIRTMIKNLSWRKATWRTIHKIIGLIHHFIRTREPGRRFTILRILWNTFYYFPALLVKRWTVQRKRCLGDDVCFQFSHNEISALNPTTYTPIFALETLQAMFMRVNTDEARIITGEIIRLNITKRQITSKIWDQQATTLIHERITPFIGDQYSDTFIKSIVKNKKWKNKDFPFPEAVLRN